MLLLPWLTTGALMAVIGIGLFFWKEIVYTEDFLHFIGQVVSGALNGSAGPVVAVITVICLLLLLGMLSLLYIVMLNYQYSLTSSNASNFVILFLFKYL